MRLAAVLTLFVMIGFALQTAAATTPPNPDPVLLLHFDEGSGTTTVDSSGNGNNGTLLDANTTNADGNTPPTWTTGRYGYALNFDGVDDYVEVPDSASLHFGGSDSFTITGWFKLDVLPSEKGVDEAIVAKHGDFLVRVDSANDKLFFRVHDGIDWAPYTSAAYALSTNTWYFFAAVYDNGTLKTYLNGELYGTGANTKADPTTNPVRIGTFFSNFLDGVIDEVRIYNRALTEEEIRQMYETSQPSAYTLTIYAKSSEDNTNISSFYAQLGDALKSTTSGSIVFDGVSGSYKLAVWAEDYAMATYTVNVNQNTTLTVYLTPSESSWVVSFKVYRCFNPVSGAPVVVKLNGNSVGSGYTDNTGSIAFRLSRLKSYTVDVNNSEKVVEIQPVENNYIIVLPCNISYGNATAGYTTSTGSYPFDLFSTAQNLSQQLSPSARGFLSALIAWLVMYGVSAVGLTSPIPGVLALAGLAAAGFTDWITVLICTLFVVAMYVLKGRVVL